MSEKPPPQTVAVTLLKAHRHAGRDYKAGQTIKLAPHKAEWLVAQQVATAEQSSAPAPQASASTAASTPAALTTKPKKD